MDRPGRSQSDILNDSSRLTGSKNKEHDSGLSYIPVLKQSDNPRLLPGYTTGK